MDFEIEPLWSEACVACGIDGCVFKGDRCCTHCGAFRPGAFEDAGVEAEGED